MTEQHKILELETRVRQLQGEIDRFEGLEQRYDEVTRDLQVREAFLHAVFRHNPFTTVVVDKDGRVVAYNNAKERSGDRLPPIGDIMYRDYAKHHSIDMHAELMRCIQDGQIRTYDNMPYGQKTLCITLSPFPDGAIVVSQDITEQKRVEKERLELIDDLQRALQEVETLRGLLPVCASCKRIRDDEGYWSDMEEYFSRRNHIDFSHTLCPECIQRLYPEIWQRMEHNKSRKEDTPPPVAPDENPAAS
jgi:PAS domain-containing protein